MNDEIVIDDEEVVRLAKLFASAWDGTPEEAGDRVLQKKRDRLNASQPSSM